jgi:translation initiation factor 2-alpha kinase 4
MSQNEESLEERQENEVEALKAIYDCDLEDLRLSDVWKVRRPPEFKLKMRPDHDSRGANQDVCSVDLHVKCRESYPNVAPELDLVNAKGISDDHVFALKGELISMARQKIGEVMVMDFAQHVSSWLQVCYF